MILGAWNQELGVPEIDPNAGLDFGAPVRIGDREFRWREIATDHPLGRFSPAESFDETSGVWALAVAIIDRPQAGKVRWQLGSDDQAVVSVNGRVVYEFLGDRGWGADQGSGEAELIAGRNVVVFRTGNSSGPWEFGMAIGGTDPQFAFLEVDPSSVVGLGAFRERGLVGDGDAARGAELFFAAEGIGCAKCHAVGKQGSADIGPNLLGVGAKYPRDELIRSILEPSNRIFSGYEMTIVETDSGETIQGVVRSETAESLVIGDAKGERITIPLESIVARERSDQSAMPSGLEKGMTPDDFADLIAYLESLKEDSP
jgi:putative heme-binding domain-containing protein